jgi:stage III sporulation protein SpoIIIAA
MKFCFWMMTMDNAIAVSFSCLTTVFQHKQAKRFEPLDRSCKYECMLIAVRSTAHYLVCVFRAI